MLIDFCMGLRVYDSNGKYFDLLWRCAPLRSPSVILNLIHGPDGSFDVLHTHEALVQAQIMTDGVLEQAIRESTRYTYKATIGCGRVRALSSFRTKQTSVLLTNGQSRFVSVLTVSWDHPKSLICSPGNLSSWNIMKMNIMIIIMKKTTLMAKWWIQRTFPHQRD